MKKYAASGFGELSHLLPGPKQEDLHLIYLTIFCLELNIIHSRITKLSLLSVLFILYFEFQFHIHFLVAAACNPEPGVVSLPKVNFSINQLQNITHLFLYLFQFIFHLHNNHLYLGIVCF